MVDRYGERYTAILHSGKVIQNYQPDAEYQSDSYRRRNQYLVDVCQYLLAVWNGSNSGTGMTVKMAQKANKYCIIISLIDYRHLGNTEKV